MVRAILLDVMGTLVYEPFWVEVPAALGLSLEQLLRDKHPRAWVDFELGAIDEATLRERFFADGRRYDHEGLKRAMRDAYCLLDGIEPILDELKQRGHALHLLSNYPPWYHLIEERVGLSRWAEWSFVSCDLGVRKPDPEAFLMAARALEVEPNELVFVDDREKNCEAARQLGIDAIVFRDAPQLREDLRDRGLL